jgi:hypothetical protein
VTPPPGGRTGGGRGRRREDRNTEDASGARFLGWEPYVLSRAKSTNCRRS